MSDAQALQVFLRSPVTQDMIHHLVTVTLQILPCESAKTITQQLPSPPNSPPIIKTKPLPSLMTFITKLVRYTNVYTGTLMATIVYLNKLKAKLPKDAQGLPCTRHRIFLACLILSSKFHNDSSPKNKHWSKYTDGLFRKEDVNLMERQLLCLLDWDLSITQSDLLSCWKRFLDPIRTDLKKQSKIRNNISKGMLAGSTQTIIVPNSSDATSQQQVQQQIPTPSATPVQYSTAQQQRVVSRMSSMSSLASSTISTPSNDPHSRSSSMASLDSLSHSDSMDSLHSRASSVSSVSSSSVDLTNTKHYPQQYNKYNYSQHNYPQQQQNSVQHKTSIVNLNDFSLNQFIDSVANRETQELNNLMRQYCGAN